MASVPVATFGERVKREIMAKPKVSATRILISSGVLLALMVTWGLFIRGSLRAMEVVSGSMEPTIVTNDRLLVRQISREARITRGEIVTLIAPQHDGPDLVKRAVAIPGDIISYRSGFFFVNGDPSPPPSGELFCHTEHHDMAYKLGPEQYYVMGDNRALSYDSSEFGPVNRDLIDGVVIYRYSPRNRMGKVK